MKRKKNWIKEKKDKKIMCQDGWKKLRKDFKSRREKERNE